MLSLQETAGDCVPAVTHFKAIRCMAEPRCASDGLQLHVQAVRHHTQLATSYTYGIAGHSVIHSCSAW